MTISAGTRIENVFKTSKEYLDLLPLSKWSDLTVRGKLLSDIIATIALLQLRSRLSGPGISTNKLIGKTQSLMCMKKRDGTILVEVPNRQSKEFLPEVESEGSRFTGPQEVYIREPETKDLKILRLLRFMVLLFGLS